MPADATPTSPTPVPKTSKTSRWQCRVLIGLGATTLLLGAAFWLLGRESTLQTLVQRVANASGGQVVVTGVSGSLYGAMHLGKIVYRSPESHLTFLNVDIDWAPWQYFTDGIAISQLKVASLSVESVGKSKPAVLPASLAPPFKLGIADAQLARVTLLNAGVGTIISDVRFKLNGDPSRWRLQDASANTPWGRLAAGATIGAKRPFATDGKASLTQILAPGSAQKPARLVAEVRGDLTRLELAANGQSDSAVADATLALAPFEPIILRSMAIKGRGVNPARFNPSLPPADLSVELTAAIDPKQNVTGKLSLSNQGAPGPLDRQRLPLKSMSGQLAGTLSALQIDDVLIDLAGAGKFSGSGSVRRTEADKGVGTLAFKLHTDRIDLKAIHSRMKTSKIAGDITLSSGGNTQTVAALLAQDGMRLELQSTLAEGLLQLQQARLIAGKSSVRVTGQARLDGTQAFKASASSVHFNPADLGDYPVADLNADANFSGALAPNWKLAADFALRPSRLFDQALSGEGRLNADPSHLSGIEARIALGQNAIDMRGNFGAPGERLAWRLAAKQLAAANSNLYGTVIGSGAISGTMAAPRTSFELNANGLGTVAAGRARADSLLHASGDAWLSAASAREPQRRINVKAAGTAQRFNPAAFGPYPAGSINAGFDVGGRLGADWRVALDLALQPSTLSNTPLTGHAKVVADAAHIENADIDLRLGANNAQAKGSFGSARDQLAWRIDAPQLVSLGPQFAGALRGDGILSGSMDRPSLSLKLDGKDLRLFGQHHIKTVRASAKLGSGRGASDPFESDIELSNYAGPAMTLDTLRLQSSGTRAAHALRLAARSDKFDATGEVKGGWNAGAWVGTLLALQNRGRFAFALQSPVPLRVAGPANSGVSGLLRPEKIMLADAVVKLPDGSITLQKLEKTGPRWHSNGQATGVPLRYLAQFSDAWRENASGDLTLGAAWALNVQAAAALAVATMDGMLHVYREKGDLIVGTSAPVVLGLRLLDARADIINNALRVQLEMDGARAGQARLDATAQLVNGRLANDSPLKLSGSADMGSIAWLAPLTGQAGLELDGALKVALTGSGTVGTPALNGDMSASKLALRWPDQGLKLRNGQLKAQLAGDQLLLQQLVFEGTEGRAQADGWVRFANGEASLQLKLVADKLEILSRPDRTVVVSGQSTLTRDRKHFELDGKFQVERAALELAAQDTPTMSADVVVLGRAGAGSGVGAKAPIPSLPLNIDLEVDLGPAFSLKAKGLDAQLGGLVRIRAFDRRPPRVTGSIRVVDGTYAAYGQKLVIERGVLNFTGAYDNPGINILALRKRPEGDALSESNVEAGVQVRGTALAPVATLVSTPNLPDSEKLSWLVLGHGTEGTAGQEYDVLSAAASALFGGAGSSNSLQSRLKGTLGLDEVGLAQAKGLESTVVTVGKRLSKRAYLSFEQGASSASSLVKLRYKLNPRITLQFQTGANTAFDVLYTWAFD